MRRDERRPGRPTARSGGAGTAIDEPAVVEDDGVVRAIGRGSVGGAVVARPAAAAAGGLERRARDVVGGQAQPALLLGGQRGRRRDRAAAVLAGGRRAAPGAVGGSEVRADAAERARRASGDRRPGRRWRGLRDVRSTAVMRAKDSRARPTGPATAIGGDAIAARERKNPGDDLFSRKAALSVSSALESLTSVFGMGTGVASPLESPGSFASGSFRQRLDARSR